MSLFGDRPRSKRGGVSGSDSMSLINDVDHFGGENVDGMVRRWYSFLYPHNINNEEEGQQLPLRTNHWTSTASMVVGAMAGAGVV